MKLTIWDIFKYIYKWKFLIAFITVIAIGMAYRYVDTKQSYSASVIIRYTDLNAKNGLTPKKEKLDVNEIISPAVITNALSDLNIKASVESIRTRISINPIIPDEIKELKKNKIKEGKEYEYNPTDYIIKYTVGSYLSGSYARDILDAIMKNYVIYYSEHHLSQSVLPEIDFESNIDAHDYIEVTEIIEQNAKETSTYLTDKVSVSPEFRSPTTGLTFEDLLNKYTIVTNFDIPTVYSDIFTKQITKNKETLIKKYIYRGEQYWLQQMSAKEESDLALNLMHDYSKNNITIPQDNKNSETDNNTNFNGWNSKDVVYDAYINREKTTYDTLVDNYVNSGVSEGQLKYSADYCQSVINIFNEARPANPNYAADEENVLEKIKNLGNYMTTLNNQTDQTIRDFNKYTVSDHIDFLSGVNITNNMSANLYVLLSFVIGIGAGMVLAIAIEIIRRLKSKPITELNDNTENKE